jgi:hypothetical protein
LFVSLFSPQEKMAGGHRLQCSGSTSSNGTPPHGQEVFPAQGDQGAGPISAAAAGVLSDPQQMVRAPAARPASGSRRAPPRRRLAFSEASPGSALLAAQALLRHPPIQATPNTPEGRWMQDIAALVGTARRQVQVESPRGLPLPNPWNIEHLRRFYP